MGAIAFSLGLLTLLLIVLPLVVSGAGGLEIDKAAPAVIEAGSVMRYTITVTNGTAQTITQVQVYDSVPPHTTYVSASMASLPGVLTATQPLAVAAGNPMTWTIASLAAGNSISMTFEVTVGRPLISGTAIYNTATISDASDRVTSTVHGTAYLTVTKTVEPDQVAAGGVVTYTLRLTNTGNGVARDIIVTDILPAGFRPYKKVWTWLGAADFLTLTLTLTATAPTTEGTYYNLVTVTYDGASITTGPTAPLDVYLRHVYLPLITRKYPLVPSWHQGGRTGGLVVYRVAACPDACQKLYAATRDNGVWSSQDGGRTWAVDGLPGVRIHWLELQPGDCETVYAATWGLGVRKKTGAGAWQPANVGLGDLYLYTLAVAPDGQTLYAGTASHGVYKSLDGGGSWLPANAGLPTGALVDALVINPGNSQVLYAGLWGEGVYRSDDGGATWTARNAGLGGQEIYALALDPADSQIVYTATYRQGVYRSGDGGDHWLLDGLPGQTVYALLTDQDGVVYAGTDGTAGVAGGKGLYRRSAVTGWVPVEPQPFARPVVRSVSLCQTVLWLGTTDGVWWYGED